MKNRHTAKQIAGESDRRHFLKLAGYGTLGFMTGGFWPLLNQSALGENTDTISKAGSCCFIFQEFFLVIMWIQGLSRS